MQHSDYQESHSPGGRDVEGIQPHRILGIPSLPSPLLTAATPIIVDNSGPTEPQLASLEDKDAASRQRYKTITRL